MKNKKSFEDDNGFHITICIFYLAEFFFQLFNKLEFRFNYQPPVNLILLNHTVFKENKKFVRQKIAFLLFKTN